MTPEVQPSFIKLERQKELVLSEVASWSQTEMRYRPDSASWSALDVLDHLVKVEEASLEAIRNQLPDGAPVTLKNRLTGLLVISVMNSPMRIKVPASATMVLPQVTSDRAGIAANWNKVRGEMSGLLGSLQTPQMRRGLFRHPVSGWMTIHQAMVFLSAHLRHHRYQLTRLKKSVSGL